MKAGSCSAMKDDFGTVKAVFEQQDVDPIAKLYADLHIALINTLQDLEILPGLVFAATNVIPGIYQAQAM